MNALEAVLQIRDNLSPDLGSGSEIFSSRIRILPVCKKGVAKLNILFSSCLWFQEYILRVAQFHNLTRILNNKASTENTRIG
jgi:hypothetical protein